MQEEYAGRFYLVQREPQLKLRWNIQVSRGTKKGSSIGGPVQDNKNKNEKNKRQRKTAS